MSVKYEVYREVVFTGSDDTIELPDDAVVSVENGGEHKVVISALIPVSEESDDE